MAGALIVAIVAVVIVLLWLGYMASLAKYYYDAVKFYKKTLDDIKEMTRER